MTALRENSMTQILRSNARVQAFHLVRDDALKASKAHVFFANLNLDANAISKTLSPFMDLVGQRIAFTSKSPAKVTFQGINGIYKLRLSDWLQFDDLCIKLLHVASGVDVLISFSTQIARTMLIRLLSTTLVDDSHGVLFSTTEKGILSFIIARLLLDLKHTLGSAMPDLKLVGIYHCQDESINDTAITDYGVFNFSFAFAHDSYPVSIALPMMMFNSVKPVETKVGLIGRVGHIARHMTFSIAKLGMTRSTLETLTFGDLIIFDRATVQLKGGFLEGSLHGVWHGIALRGVLKHEAHHYVFVADKNELTRMEDTTMDELEIAGESHSNPLEINDARHRKLADLAKNIRVTLSIELSRLPLTLKEVCQIREGEIIDLHRKIDDPLDMVVEGKVIGQCQPVQIDGRLGIRVLSVDDNSNNAV